MDYFKAAAISAAGMSAQKMRIEAAAANLANMHTTSAPGVQGYQPVEVVIRGDGHSFNDSVGISSGAFAPVHAEVMAQRGLTSRQAYEPGHPDADPAGMVVYPSIDHTKEMMTVMTALRTYEANLAALQATKTLAAKALQIGA